ncbi:MAG: AraC family transcriptional regulator [Synechococcaceae cyanobacterium]
MLDKPGGAAASLPLLFHDQHTQHDRDPQALAERLAQHHPVLAFAPLHGHAATFVHRTNTIRAGSLLLTSGYSSPIEGAMGEESGNAYVQFAQAGSIRYQTQGLSQTIHPGRPLWFSPGAEYRYTTDHLNALVMRLDLGRLRSTAAAIAGLGVAQRRFASDLELARVLGCDNRRNRELIQVFRRTLSLLDNPALDTHGHLDALQVDDLIYRVLALLLHPRLDAVLAVNRRGGVAPRERILEELLEWIRANLHTPVNLTELERRSGYSRRTLQLAFKQRFGCGPVQWVRRQRLEQARQALLRAQPGERVGEIASRFGFAKLTVFSRDFRAHFGLRPSELIHEGRRQHR